MSNVQSSSSTSSSNINELRWIINIRRSLDEELKEEIEVPVSIFTVPKPLMATDPESYIPQLVAFGPYHYWRPELYEMERYKLAAVKRSQKQLQKLKFDAFVDQLIKLEPRIRAFYHKYLDFNGETLAWMMAIDASFFLEFLQIYALKEGKTLSRVSSRMSHLVDYAGRKSAHNSILRDIVMLENQIPLFVLRKVLEIQYLSLESADDMLVSMLKGLCQELSPFKMMENSPKIDVSNCAHILDFLFDTVVPKVDAPFEPTEAEEEAEDHKEDNNSDSADPSYMKQLFNEAWNLVLKKKRGPFRLIKAVLLSRPLRVILKLPWKILSNFSGFSILQQPIEYLFFSQENIEDQGKPDNLNNKPPLAEEIAVPSVSDLVKSGVHFSPTNGNITTISFVPFLDKVIEDVNRYYNCRWNVKASNFFKHYVYGSWQFLTLLAAVMLLLLMTFQAFCSVYSCSRIFRIQTSK